MCYLFVYFIVLIVVTCFQTAYKVNAFATAEEYRLESLVTEAPKYGYVVVQLPEGNRFLMGYLNFMLFCILLLPMLFLF